jgi:dihydrofolate reductase
MSRHYTEGEAVDAGDKLQASWHNAIMFDSLKQIFKKEPPIVIVSAMSRIDRGIGHKNDLLWHIPDDLKRFKRLTSGHPIIMGRKTFESILSILGKPLPGRTNIVVTRDTTYLPEGATVTHSIEAALIVAKQEKPTEIHIGGGAQLYRQLLPKVSRLHVTWVDDKPGADTFFPPFEDQFVITKTHEPREHKGLGYQWIDYFRKRS